MPIDLQSHLTGHESSRSDARFQDLAMNHSSHLDAKLLTLTRAHKRSSFDRVPLYDEGSLSMPHPPAERLVVEQNLRSAMSPFLHHLTH